MCNTAAGHCSDRKFCNQGRHSRAGFTKSACLVSPWVVLDVDLRSRSQRVYSFHQAQQQTEILPCCACAESVASSNKTPRFVTLHAHEHPATIDRLTLGTLLSIRRQIASGTAILRHNKLLMDKFLLAARRKSGEGSGAPFGMQNRMQNRGRIDIASRKPQPKLPLVYQLKEGVELHLMRADITRLECDAIINAGVGSCCLSGNAPDCTVKPLPYPHPTTNPNVQLWLENDQSASIPLRFSRPYAGACMCNHVTTSYCNLNQTGLSEPGYRHLKEAHVYFKASTLLCFPIQDIVRE